jgi:hypothetical protein
MRSINAGRSQEKSTMLLSSRAQPPKALKDFPYPSRSNLSVKQFLLHSPLPSPALPALVPRHGKKPPPFNSRRALRYLAWLTITITLYNLFTFISGLQAADIASIPALPYLTSSGKTYEIVAESELPDYPTPIGVIDKYKGERWTISVPERHGFPLTAVDYADVCSHIPEVASHISSKSAETTFIDVGDAQRHGLLPPPRTRSISSTLPICDTSLTYVLDATDAGLGSTLMGLWIAYAQAKREHRAFFIDDTHFAFGTFSTYFTAPPKPKCRPPPPSQRIPCVPQAKHTVVSAATHRWSFGPAFQAKYSTSETYTMAREGYEALFHLRTDDAEYVTDHLAAMRAESSSVIGIHLRRGDRHPFTLAYSRAYLPPTHYLSAATELSSSISSSTPPTTLLATDDPELYAKGSPLSHLTRAQSRITLASKSSLGDGGIGWEGGFFAELFWSLGLPAEIEWQKRIGSPLPSRMVAEMGENERSERDWRAAPTKEAKDMRELIARAWLLDLAMLGGSDGVVCAVSSYTCRLLAVMLGEEAVRDGRWRNVESGYPWAAMDA